MARADAPAIEVGKEDRPKNCIIFGPGIVEGEANARIHLGVRKQAASSSSFKNLRVLVMDFVMAVDDGRCVFAAATSDETASSAASSSSSSSSPTTTTVPKIRKGGTDAKPR